MRIAFNPSTVEALTTPPNNKDITFDLRGRNIFARGVKFYGTDTNTWRDIKINNVSIGSYTLDLRNGSNTTLTNTNGVVTINSTWRPVVDNLTSDSTTSSLSAKQGEVLKALIDGKSNSGHTHDDRYVKKSGDIMSGVLTIDTTTFGALTIKRNDDVNGASIQFRGKSNIYGYIGFNAANRNKQLLRWNDASSQVYTILDTSSTYTSGGKGVINGTTITQVDNADKLDGYHANTSRAPFGCVPTIEGDGVMKIGKYIDFHCDNEGKYDYSTRLQVTGNHQNVLSLPSESGTLALTSQIPNKNSWNYDDRYYTKAESDIKYITDITTSVNKLTFTKNGSNIARDITVNIVQSQGNLTNIPDKNATTKASSGLVIYNSYGQTIGTNLYSSVLSINTGGAIQIAGDWGDDTARNLYWRSQSDRNIADYPWKSWRTILDNENYSSILDSRYYTETEVNSLLDAKLNTGLLRYSRNNVNISSPNCSPIPPSLLEWTIGYPRLYDPEFNDSYNNVWVYNNNENGVVTVTRVQDTNVGNSSNYVIKVVSAAGASPNYGGWHVATQTELGKVYTCLFRARIPSGVEIEWNSNPIGNGGQVSWLTNNMGTDKWTWYAVQVYCGSGGSTTFFFSAKSPCTWYLSYVNVIENNRASYAGLRSVYSDYLKANASIVFGRNELQYFNQNTDVTAGATNNANPKTDWYHILRMNHANTSGFFVDLAIPFFDNRIQFRRITSGLDNGWRRVITEEPNHNVLLCDDSGGGSVGIGISSPAQKLDVNGGVKSSGFYHSSVNSDNYILLAGGGYKSFGGDYLNPIFLGYLNLDHGNDGTISSSFSCLGYSVPFTYTRGGNYCRIFIPDTTHQIFYIKAATASVNYSGGGMDAWTNVHRGGGSWWLHCYAENTNEVRVKGFCQNNKNNDSWWGGNPLWSGNDGANRITVCIFGYVRFT